ncbi:hypothetical protein CRECT_2400 [Campylobacter rectus]|uniref:Uncharacterized protein n=1 Tax=Campylobacter rectus TaxID=203 RepID=A0A6G5QR07_CAMRE|nr:hypothetical protein CRECT_2400 [Campylobacter rectus]
MSIIATAYFEFLIAAEWLRAKQCPGAASFSGLFSTKIYSLALRDQYWLVVCVWGAIATFVVNRVKKSLAGK